MTEQFIRVKDVEDYRAKGKGVAQILSELILLATPAISLSRLEEIVGELRKVITYKDYTANSFYNKALDDLIKRVKEEK